MMRYIVPLILCIAAVGLFILYINPTYQASQALAAQNASYNEALSKAAQLHAVRDQLLAKRNSFSNDDITKLQSVLPDNVDNIRLIIDINNIAAQHGLSLSAVSLGDLSSNATAPSGAVGASTGPVGSVEVGFTVTTDYPTFLAFLQDLEHSLRIIDVDSITFSVGTQSNTLTPYALQIRTYWLH
jgi:Tfp pilus assembly protein PilO